MNPSPLIKTRLSNERLMSALLLVLLLYNLPQFIAAPSSILPLLLLIVIGLTLDTAAHYILYKRPICAVSAAVTALILYTLSPGATFWAACAALAAALVIGKALWGGTGKNPLNPAMLGLAFLAILSPLKLQAFEASWYLLPAILLSLPFLLIRPYAGLGMIIGILGSLLLRQDLTVGTIISTGVFFWGCLVITDPVTTTSKPAAGFIIGLLAGFVPIAASLPPAAMPIGILVSNLLSYLSDWLNIGPNERLRKTFGRNQKILLSGANTGFTDLTGEESTAGLDIIPPCEEILRRIEKNKVFGMGGAAFPTGRKLQTVMDADVREKHLIINAAECDPGLVHDKWLLKNHSKEILTGIDILQKCVTFKSITMAAKDLNGLCLPAIVRYHKVTDYYPAGAEKILIENVQKVPLPEGVPATSGILVLNVQTVYAIYVAVIHDRAADTRFLTAAELDSRTGTVVRVRLGDGVYETARKLLVHAVNVYAGGGVMNACLSADGAVIDEKTNFLASGQVIAFREAICSQCNLCSAYCPASLHVREIAHYIDANKPQKAALLHPEKCMECALCSCVCLAGRDQAARIRAAKKYVSANNSLANA